MRPEARRILVVTEGERTEPQYVERLNAFLRSSGVTTHVKPVGVGKDPSKVVAKCIEIRDRDHRAGKGYDECICLIDVDQHTTIPQAQAMAAAEDILLLVSNLKFEVWLRRHVEDKSGALNSAQLGATVQRLGLVEGKLIAESFPFDAYPDAVLRARRADPQMKAGRVGPDPSTAMPLLVELMRGG